MQNILNYAVKKPLNTDQFGFTTYSWHEIPFEKLNTKPLKEWLMKHFNLADYGTGIIEFVVGFVIFPSNYEDTEPPERTYLKQKKLISFSYPIHYETFVQTNFNEGFEMMKTAFFKGVKEVLPTLKIKDFDVNKFIIDLKKVLNN